MAVCILSMGRIIMNSTRHFRLLNSEYAIKHIKRLKNKRGQLLSMVSLIPLAACGGGVNPFTVNVEL